MLIHVSFFRDNHLIITISGNVIYFTDLINMDVNLVKVSVNELCVMFSAMLACTTVYVKVIGIS